MFNAKKHIHLFILCMVLSISAIAQTPGLIIKPATGGGSAILDPDGDGYVSQKTNGIQRGFTIPPDNDVLQSEIPYVALVRPDVQGDLERGPTGGFTEIVGTDAAGNNAILTYTDGVYLYYRFRLSGYAPNSKSYSILIDTDGKFGFTGPNADQNAVTGNPGFEAEVVLETNFNVYAYNVDGSATRPSTPAASALYDTNCQKSMAVSRAGNDPDYFYDFYLPFPTSLFTKNTPLRYVALTSMNPFPAIGNNAVSDVGGVGSFTNLDQAFTDLVTAQTPTLPGQEVVERSDCPTINGPITTASSTISGTSTESNGTIIKIYRNGSLTPIGTTTVSGNTWTFSLGAVVLASGDIITATATASNEGESIGNCNPRTVQLGNAPPCYAPAATALTMDSPKKTLTFDFVVPSGYNPADFSFKIYDSSNAEWVGALTKTGNTYSYYNNSGIKDASWYVVVSHTTCLPTRTYYCSGTYSTTPTIMGPVNAGSTSISGTCGSAATVTVFKNDLSQGTATVSGTSWTKAGLTLSVGDRLYVTSTNSGLCTAVSGNTTVVCSPSVTPVINQNVYAGDANLTGTCGAGATVTIYKDGVSVGTATVSGSSWSKPISSLVGNTTRFYVTSTEPGKCESVSSEITVRAVPVPVISGTYCGSTTSVSGYIPGTTANIQLYKVGTPAVAIGALTATNASGNWTVSGLNLSAGDQIYAIAILSRGSTSTSTNITIGNKTTNAVAIGTNPIYEGMTSLTGTGTNGDVITLYIADAPTFYNASWSGNTWTISGIANYEFYPGAKVYVTATTPGLCESSPSSIKTVQCVVPNIPLYTTEDKSYCLGSSGELSLSTSEVGVAYQLVNGSGVPLGLEYAGTGGAVILKTNPLFGNLLNVYVRAYKLLNPSCSTISSAAINFKIQSPSPTVSFTNTALTVTTGATSVNLDFTSKSNNPLADRYTIDYPINANALGLADISNQPLGSSTIGLTIPGTLPIGTYYGSIIISSSAGNSCSNIYGFSITVAAAGSPPVIVNQSSNVSICSGNTTTLNVTATGSPTAYQWQSSTAMGGPYTNIAAGVGSGATTASYITAALTATTYYKVIVTNANGSVTSNVTTVAVNPTVSGTGTISGTSTVCAGQNSVNYSVSGISNATTYNWTYTPNTGVTINGNGSSVFINFGNNATSGDLSVVGVNSCGTGISYTLYHITVNALPTVNAGVPLSVCSNSTGVNFAADASALNYTSIAWSSSGTPGTIANSTSLNAATYTPSAADIAAGSVTFTLTATGSCGTVTSTKAITITAAPVASAGDPISTCTGLAAIPMTGATASGTYTGTPTWSGGEVKGTWTQNANPALATFTPSAASGSFTATLTLNGCSNATSTRTITWGIAPTPSFTSAATASSCVGNNIIYTTESLQNNYTWSIPGILDSDYSIMAGTTASNSITIKWLTPGSKTVTVNYKNADGCPGSAPATNTTTVYALPTPSEIIIN